MALPEGLLEILACPVDKGDLLYFADEDLLYNPRLRRAYRIEAGVPVLLPQRAEPVTPPEHERLIGRARDAGRVPATRLPEQPGSVPPSLAETPRPQRHRRRA